MLYLAILSYLRPSCPYIYYASGSIQLLQMNQVIGLVENRNGVQRKHLAGIPVFKAKFTIQLHIF